MDKRYIIVVSVVVALWASFMVYRHMKGKQESQEYRTKEYARITDVALKSPKAGLNQMARALKKYYLDKKRYPETLQELYPEYIRNKSFLDEPDWYYESGKSDFLLTKTVVRREKRMVAAVDKRLSPWIQTSSMVAAPTKPVEKKIEVEKAVDDELSISARSREQFWQALRQRQEERAAAYMAEGGEEKIITIPQPEILNVAESEAASPVETEVGQKYLVWKSKQGNLGFGNVEYPSAETQSRYAMGSWYSLKIPTLKTEMPLAIEREIEDRRLPEAIASDFSGRYLVWKGQGDTIGFGNVQYPEQDHVYVFETDTWVHVPKTAVAMETVPEEGYVMLTEKTPEGIASEFSRQYLVWKDEHGNLGFGNVETPQTSPVSVYETDTWIAVEKPPMPADVAVDSVELVADRSQRGIASDLSPRYLVWKDRDGNLGFGNVEYPEEKSVSYVNVNGSWEKVFN